MNQKLIQFSFLIIILLGANVSTIFAQNGTTKKKEQTLADYNKAIEQNPRSAKAYYNRGYMYLDQQKYDLAIADYTKAITLDPKYSDAYLNRGVSYKRKERYTEALADYAKVVQLDPKDPAVYKNQGIVYEILKNYDLALVNFTKAINLGPKNNSGYYFSRGNFYLYSTKQLDLALADFNKMVEIAPNEANGYNAVGAVYNTKEQFTLAITNFTKAIEIDPKFLLAYINRADSYDAIGNTKLADLDRKKYSDLGGEISAAAGNTRRSIYPQGNFDPALAKTALSRGLSRIEGRACSKIDGLIFKADGAKVVLYPVTPYLEEWYALRDKKESKKVGVYMSKEANQYVIEAVADEQGRFIFEGLKPGKYFIHMIYNFNQLKTNRVYTGSNTQMQGNGQVITNYYHDENYVVERSDRVERFVEIKKDGEIKKTSLAKGLIKGCDF